MNDDELERAFRDGLRRRADRVAVPSGVVTRQRASRRRRAALLASVAAAAAVIVVAVGVDVVHLQPGQEPGVSDPGRSTAAAIDTSGWRTEVWHGLQVSVPADWGWGTAPVRGYLCGGPGAVVTADGQEHVNADPHVPYVGRPIMLSDSCNGGFAEQSPTAPYVWLGADIPAGTVGLGNGYVQQTVEVHGTTLTVASDDAAVRRRILDSATADACPSLVDVSPLPRAYTVGPGTTGQIVGGEMCAYKRSTGPLLVVYAGALDAEQAQAYAHAAAAAPEPGSPDDGAAIECPSGQLVVVRLTRRDAGGVYVQNTVVNPDCGWVTSRSGDYRTLDEATRTALLDIGGLRAVFPTDSVTSGS